MKSVTECVEKIMSEIVKEQVSRLITSVKTQLVFKWVFESCQWYSWWSNQFIQTNWNWLISWMKSLITSVLILQIQFLVWNDLGIRRKKHPPKASLVKFNNERARRQRFAKSFLIKDIEHPVYLKKYLSSAEREIDKKISALRHKKVTKEGLSEADFRIKNPQLF